MATYHSIESAIALLEIALERQGYGFESVDRGGKIRVSVIDPRRRKWREPLLIPKPTFMSPRRLQGMIIRLGEFVKWLPH